ncbi:hypothetical protein FRC09_008942, partial [Ceratobasidium sp. 395]
MLLAFATAAALPTLALSNSIPLGVPPKSAALYNPITSTTPATWKCLDGSQTIRYSAINDDYCDCPDGSDEPGTSACPNGTFYCKNEGHIGASIRSTHVNDGLCEPECCDGSDEPSGVCPNQCEEIGVKYRAEQEAERKLRKTGAKIRSSYIAYAKKEIGRLNAASATLQRELTEKRAEEARLKTALEHTESIDAAALDHQKQSSLYQSLLSHNSALTSLRAKQAELQSKLDTLEEILAGLKRSYNPNYQDMGVLEAVRGWDAYHGVEPEPVVNQAGTDPLATEAEIIEAQANLYAAEGTE